jgi:hypothetical protein
MQTYQYWGSQDPSLRRFKILFWFSMTIIYVITIALQYIFSCQSSTNQQRKSTCQPQIRDRYVNNCIVKHWMTSGRNFGVNVVPSRVNIVKKTCIYDRPGLKVTGEVDGSGWNRGRSQNISYRYSAQRRSRVRTLCHWMGLKVPLLRRWSWRGIKPIVCLHPVPRYETHIVECRPVAMRRPRDKWLHSGRC